MVRAFSVSIWTLDKWQVAVGAECRYRRLGACLFSLVLLSLLRC